MLSCNQIVYLHFLLLQFFSPHFFLVSNETAQKSCEEAIKYISRDTWRWQPIIVRNGLAPPCVSKRGRVEEMGWGIWYTSRWGGAFLKLLTSVFISQLILIFAQNMDGKFLVGLFLLSNFLIKFSQCTCFNSNARCVSAGARWIQYVFTYFMFYLSFVECWRNECILLISTL